MSSVSNNIRIEDSVFAVQFSPLLLSDTKKAELSRIAHIIRDIKNEVAGKIHPEFERYAEMKKYDFERLFEADYRDLVSSHFLHKCLEDVYNSLQHRHEAFLKHIKFEHIYQFEITRYKVNTKHHRKGDFKGIDKRTKSTDLSKVLTYLARYYRPGLMDYIETHREANRFYPVILEKINKFGLDRLTRLAMQRRDRIYRMYLERGPIRFESLTFRGRSRLKCDIVRANKNQKSRITHFITISWVREDGSTEPLCIPVKYNRQYHRNIKRYCLKTETPYTVVFRGNRIYFVLYRDGKRITPAYEITEENTIGIDVNSKHNMLALSDGRFIPHDAEFVKEFTDHLLAIDRKQKEFDRLNNGSVRFTQSRRDMKKSMAIAVRIREYVRRVAADLCKNLQARGIHHIAMEDLDGFIGARLRSDNADGINIGRLCRRISLSSIKDEFIHIAPHYGISVSLVHACYTSQECECGCIDAANRPTQEVFHCIQCEHEENADRHSSNIIKSRLTSTVLRGKLLDATDSGYSMFLPKSLPRWRIKDTLEKCRKEARQGFCGA